MAERSRQLTAEPLSDAPLSDAPSGDDVDIEHGADALLDEHARQERTERFTAGLRSLRVGTLNLNERVLMIAGGVVAPLGILIVLLGWWGAARTPYTFEQVPYLISGGLLGVALVFLGAFFYFTHWMTQLVKEHRAQSLAMIEAITRLQDEVARQADGERFAGGSPSRNGAGGEVALVVTPNGSMAHRTDCVVVAGKSDLRRVSADDGLAPCKLCDPYA